VAGPVALHVAAKRYLCATEPGYEQALSPASRLSLELQGGRFTAEEQAVFERSPFAADAVRLRRWDDAGKIPDLVIPGLEHYRPLLERLAVV
jgi:gamma-butyrobetaine dioxygenase